MTTTPNKPLLGTTGEVMDSPNGGGLRGREKKAELFVASVSTLGGDSAYESEEARLDRIRRLTHDVALSDPGWTMSFTNWLRDEANVRSLPTTIAIESVKARLDAGVVDTTGSTVPGVNRTMINVACQRADEPSKIIEYWFKHHGRALPPALKRGLADAVRRLYNEFSALKYDTDALAIRFGDVIELVHPKPVDSKQGDLFEWLLNRRHGRKSEYFESLGMVNEAEHSREHAKADPVAERDRLLGNPDVLKRTGFTWEHLSGMGPMDAEAWEAVIPRMGYMALLRNLRNFDKVGISASAVKYVQKKLSDPDEVARSRQFPFRFYSAYIAADKRWAPTLEKALEASLSRVPVLDGRTLVLVDCSGSMGYNETSWLKKAALFGTVLKFRNPESTTLVAYGTDSKVMRTRGSVLETVQSFSSMGGTQTGRAINDHLKGHTRLIVITDEQTFGVSRGFWATHHLAVESVVPKGMPFYTWNLAGYRGAQAKTSDTWHAFAGLTDACFSMIPLIEAGKDARWPFSV